MIRLGRSLGVMLIALACALPGAAQQPKKKRATSTPAKQPSAAPAYPYMEAIHQNDLGIDLMDHGQFADAYAKFEMACIMDIESDIGCQNSGIALLAMKNYESARQMLSKSTERNPEYARAWFNLGVLERAQGHADAAVADFEKVAAIDPTDADTQCLIGLTRLGQKQYDRAISAFTKALALDPLLASAELGLAQAMQQKGDADGSLAHLARLEDMTAKNTGRTVEFAYGQAGKFSKAEKIVPPEAGTQPTTASPAP
jgi:tetratricopeptide (TPR) repeat protein